MAGSATKLPKKKSTKLDTKIPDDIKEKSYITKQVDTSIAILESPENDVVLEALLFLSKYADIRLNNLNYLQQKGLMLKLLNLFNRNICILRLALRLMNLLLTIEDVFIELDQEMYDGKITEITNLYINHGDLHIREFCVSILSKLATSCRITCLIFKANLFDPIINTIKFTKNQNLLETTMEFFYVLLNAPATLSTLPEVETFDVSPLLTQLNNKEPRIAELTYKILLRFTALGMEVFQKMFRQAKLVEKMLDVVLKPEKKPFHNYALDIIINCMSSDETSTYFIESLEFLNFCQWVKTCDADYLWPCVNIFEKLSKINSIKQTLFDLSVEETILYILRSKEKRILNKACEAISNMSVHKYCCEHMLTPQVLRTIVAILERKDDEDPENEIALKTVFDFTRRCMRTMEMLYAFGTQQILLDYFLRGYKVLSDESFLRVMEMLYKFAVNPLYQRSVVSDKLFAELLKLVNSDSDTFASLASEMLTNFLRNSEFNRAFLSMKGPGIFIKKLRSTSNPTLFKNILLFIHCSLIDESMVMAFLHNDLVKTLKNLPASIKSRAPLVETTLNLTYNIHLPLKLFETKRIDITDKLKNRFYIINGPWEAPFPFLEILQAENISTISTIYVVDYTYELAKYSDKRESNISDISADSTYSKRLSSSRRSSFTSAYSSNGPFTINYGQLSPDRFLPKYIYHIAKYLADENSLEQKIKILAEYVDTLLCGPKEDFKMPQKIHEYKLHIQSLKFKLGTNLIPIGFLRIGFHCERALLFKAIADRNCIPCSLVKGRHKLYWNEVALLHSEHNDVILKFYIVDLMDNVGNLLMVGSREANQYCNSNAGY